MHVHISGVDAFSGVKLLKIDLLWLQVEGFPVTSCMTSHLTFLLLKVFHHAKFNLLQFLEPLWAFLYILVILTQIFKDHIILL